jgi:hypothetical protein
VDDGITIGCSFFLVFATVFATVLATVFVTFFVAVLVAVLLDSHLPVFGFLRVPLGQRVLFFAVFLFFACGEGIFIVAFGLGTFVGFGLGTFVGSGLGVFVFGLGVFAFGLGVFAFGLGAFGLGAFVGAFGVGAFGLDVFAFGLGALIPVGSHLPVFGFLRVPLGQRVLFLTVFFLGDLSCKGLGVFGFATHIHFSLSKIYPSAHFGS